MSSYKLPVFVLTFLVFLAGCGPSQTTIDKDRQIEADAVRQTLAELTPYTGFYFGPLYNESADATRWAVLEIGVYAGVNTNLGRSENSVVPNVTAALHICEGNVKQCAPQYADDVKKYLTTFTFTTGAYDRVTQKLALNVLAANNANGAGSATWLNVSLANNQTLVGVIGGWYKPGVASEVSLTRIAPDVIRNASTRIKKFSGNYFGQFVEPGSTVSTFSILQLDTTTDKISGVLKLCKGASENDCDPKFVNDPTKYTETVKYTSTGYDRSLQVLPLSQVTSSANVTRASAQYLQVTLCVDGVTFEGGSMATGVGASAGYLKRF